MKKHTKEMDLFFLEFNFEDLETLLIPPFWLKPHSH